MRWISLKDAPALIGGDSRREELGLAGAAGDVSARLRHENGTSSPMRCQLWLLTDLIDWGRSSIRWPRHPSTSIRRSTAKLPTTSCSEPRPLP